MKRVALYSLVVLALAAAWFFALRPGDNNVGEVRVLPRPPKAQGNSATATSEPSAVIKEKEGTLERLDLAKDLNAPSKTIEDDLKALDGVFSVWQVNFLHQWNPFGENSEITAALIGRNALHVAFIAPEHPAINKQGELCDRWGTPFFFHQVSGSKMQILSYGPDRKRGTADDVVFSP